MTPVEILETAAGLVGGDRAKQHGDYRLLHQRVADLWSAYLKTDLGPVWHNTHFKVLLMLTIDFLVTKHKQILADVTAA